MLGPGIVDDVLGSHLFVLILQVFDAGHRVSSHFPPLHSFTLEVLVHTLAPSLHAGVSSSLPVSAQLLANVERAPNNIIQEIGFLIGFLILVMCKFIDLEVIAWFMRFPLSCEDKTTHTYIGASFERGKCFLVVLGNNIV